MGVAAKLVEGKAPGFSCGFASEGDMVKCVGTLRCHVL
jgi:hypothetical protein